MPQPMSQPTPYPAHDGHRPAPRPAPQPAPRPTAPATEPAETGWGGGWASLAAGEPTTRVVSAAPAGNPATDVRGDDQAATPRPPGRRAARTADEDSSGRELAMRLPGWDLLPPTEFVQRRRGR